MGIDELIEITVAAGGVIHAVAAAEALEVTSRRVRETARRHGWQFLHRDVVGPPGTPSTPEVRAKAAVAQLSGADLDVPRPVAVSRWSGAHLLGVGIGSPVRVQVHVPVHRAPRSVPDRIEVIRTRTWDGERIEEVDGVPVLAAPWIVRSCAPVANLSTLTDLVIDLVQTRRTTLDEVAAEHDRWPRYPGRGRVAEVLARLDAAGRTDVSSELRVRERLVAAGVPLDHGQVAVPCADGRSVHLDLGIASIRFGIDHDSMLAHSKRSQLLADVRRSNALTTADDDWRILRATVEDLGRGWDRFLASVRDAVHRQAQRYLGVPWPRPEDVVTPSPR
ncbi:MAG: hypothetical protein WEB03_00480 [Nitriliruptor sp.]|uniref:hypothetical protein n=1 Tax=Nitriliruptor sp. TaxID=2448056 RepID=UPI0034A00A02